MHASSRNNSSSVRRALAILDVLTREAARGISLAELTQRIGTSKSTVLRLLAPLVEASLVQQRGEKYTIGVGAVLLGSAYLNNLDLRSVAQPVLAELASVSKETVHLMVYNEGQVVYLDKVTGSSPIQMVSRVGDRAPVHSTASGKAILAHLPESEFLRVVAAGMPARTEHTLVTPEQLTSNLADIRLSGYSLDESENEDGIYCVAAPIFDHAATVIAAVSVSGPRERIKDNLEDIIILVVSGAGKISSYLGGPDRSEPNNYRNSTTTEGIR